MAKRKLQPAKEGWNKLYYLISYIKITKREYFCYVMKTVYNFMTRDVHNVYVSIIVFVYIIKRCEQFSNPNEKSSC